MVDNTEDIIDSRDVIARLRELEEMTTDDSYETDTPLDEIAENNAEYDALLKLAEQGEDLSDWQYGEALIRDSYFEDYARDLADEIGATNSDHGWPLNCIDWERAARELRMDYTSVDFDGITYWGRS